MIKKILFIIVFLSFVISCGKKGDPEYKAFNNSISYIQII